MMMSMTTDEALAVLDAAAVYVNSEIIPMKKARAHFATLTERLRVVEGDLAACKEDMYRIPNGYALVPLKTPGLAQFLVKAALTKDPTP